MSTSTHGRASAANWSVEMWSRSTKAMATYSTGGPAVVATPGRIVSMISTISSKLSECSCREAATSGGMSCRRGNAERNAEVRTPCLACHAAASVASRSREGVKSVNGRVPWPRPALSRLRSLALGYGFGLVRFGVAMSSGNAYSVLRQVLLWFGAREIDSGLGWSLWDRSRAFCRGPWERAGSYDEGSFWHESFGDRCDGDRCAPSGAITRCVSLADTSLSLSLSLLRI